jgi:hypothetical protein
MRIVRSPIIRLLLAAALVVGPLAGVALAKRGHASGSSSLELVSVDPSDTTPNHGDQITFAVRTDSTDKPYVHVLCSQDGSLVFSAGAGFFPDYAWQSDQVMTLASSSWTSGAADCTATLDSWDGRRWTNLKSLDFHVYA